MVDVVDTFTMEANVGTNETTIGSVPAKRFARFIYGIILNEQSGTVNTITIKQYSGATLEKSWTFKIAAYDTIDIVRDINTPIFVIPGGRSIAVVASAASVQVIMQAYDK